LCRTTVCRIVCERRIVAVFNLDDDSLYIPVYSFCINKAFTWANMDEGRRDLDRREFIRESVVGNFPDQIPDVAWWAFRFYVKKSGSGPFDIENVPKTYVDAFCEGQMKKDNLKLKRDNLTYKNLGIYEDDRIDYVRVIEVGGERVASKDQESTCVEIFGRTNTTNA